MHSKCWASTLGGCSKKLSREHIISAAFFEGSDITVTGFDWTGEGSFTVSLSSATAKILCSKHNTGLSDLDSEIKGIGRTFKCYSEAVIDWSPNSSEENYFGNVDGTKFERWMPKTVLNVICASPKRYGGFKPDRYLADLVFGHVGFNYGTGMGLYFLNSDIYAGELIISNLVSVRPLIISVEGQVGLFGAIVTFWGFPFFLKTIPWTENLRLEFRGNDLIDNRLYHLEFLESFTDRLVALGPKIRFQYEA